MGHSRRFDYLTATSARPRTTDISDRAGMAEKCDFRTIPMYPKVNLAHPAGLAYRLPGNQWEVATVTPSEALQHISHACPSIGRLEG
jgi:hypothetical protein